MQTCAPCPATPCDPGPGYKTSIAQRRPYASLGILADTLDAAQSESDVICDSFSGRAAVRQPVGRSPGPAGQDCP